ncbi:MAG: 50S ribosomal protein L31 [Anaerolineaceae bacterium]|nr:50S ribosomal protein L31 [Anaerolineaceae bacterium]
MKKGIHPKYYPNAKVICACGNTWETGSTQEVVRTEVCSKCHPFFTGQQSRLLDREGQVDRFYRRLQARQEYAAQQESQFEDRPLDELKLSKRVLDALKKVDITTAGQALEKLGTGDKAVLDIGGFGQKSLIDLKKALKTAGYELPVAE